MGIIARQSSKAALVTYIGVALGLLNQIIVYPLALSIDKLGELQFVLQTASFFPPFILLGLNAVITKYYANYSYEPELKQSLYGAVVLTVSLNSVVFLALFLAFKDTIISYYNDASGISSLAVYVLIALSILFSYSSLASSIAAIRGRIAIPNLLNQLVKIILPILALLYFSKLISFDQVLISLLAYYVSLTIFYIYYITRQDEIKPNLSLPSMINRLDLKSLSIFGFFSLLSGIGASLTTKIDIIMITSSLGAYQNGLYSWALFIANAISIPYMLISVIATPIISSYFKNEDYDAIQRLYKTSSASILLLALLAFFTVWLSIDDLFLLMPRGNEFNKAKNMVLILGVAAIVDMACGVNSHIISMSQKFKHLLAFLFIAVLLNVSLNYLLIPKYGIEGSGIATLVSILVFNVCKYIFIKKHLKISPFSSKTIQIALLGISLYIVTMLIPGTKFPLLNILINTSFFGGLFMLAAYKLKLSPEINQFVNKQLIRIRIQPFD